MKLKERIEKQSVIENNSEKYNCPGLNKGTAFKNGAYFAIEAIIEMLEENIKGYDKHKDDSFFRGAIWEDEEIINLLKSEA